MINTNNSVFHLFHGKTGLVAAAVTKAIVGWVGESGCPPHSRPRRQQLEGASPLSFLPSVREACRD